MDNDSWFSEVKILLVKLLEIIFVRKLQRRTRLFLWLAAWSDHLRLLNHIATPTPSLHGAGFGASLQFSQFSTALV